ncbi:type II toxin-antitoxin system Phd/YefM family antitoxin [Methylomicrobium agile]|nr:type II toxin-antitoxin system prevent-host-death family antitoxin [Methylomicrobium agile]
MQVNILEAKNSLSSLIVAAERDEEVIIARNGKPVARIVKYEAPKVAAPGAWRGKAGYAADWNSAGNNAEVERLFTEDDDASAA